MSSLYPAYEGEKEKFLTLLADRTHSRIGRLAASGLDAFCQQAWENKTGLARIWGMPEDGDRRLHLDTMDREAFRQTTEYTRFRNYLLRHHGEWLAGIEDLDQKIAENKLDEGKQSYRLIRWARKHVDAGQFATFIQRRNEAEWASLPTDLEAFIERLLRVSAEMRLPAIVSLNPLDFLLMSDCGKYSACTTIGHQHPAGNTSHALDDMTGMVFSLGPVPAEYPFNKLGRTLVYQPGDRRKIVFMRVYGIMNDMQIKEVSNQLSRRTAAALKMDNSWTAVQNVSFRWDQLPHEVGHRQHHGPSTSPDTDFPIFMDFSVVRLAIHESALEAKQVGFAEECTDGSCPEDTCHGDSRLPRLTPHPQAMCLSCGNLHWEAKGYICSKCSKSCQECGEQRIYEWVNSEPYCEGCYWNLPLCSNCQTIIPAGNGNAYCAGCALAVGVCAVCETDNPVYRRRILRADGRSQLACDACFATLRYCDACGARWLAADFRPDSRICQRCPLPICVFCGTTTTTNRRQLVYSYRFSRDVQACDACAACVHCSVCEYYVLQQDCYPDTQICVRHSPPHEISEPESEPTMESEVN